MLILGGVAKINIGTDTIFNRCPACEADKEVDILVTSTYFHIYYIPFYPRAKEVTLICNSCGLKRTDLPFSDRYIGNYHEIKSNYRHPLYLYLGASVLTILIVSLVIAIIK